jgi:hypothetical protein
MQAPALCGNSSRITWLIRQLIAGQDEKAAHLLRQVSSERTTPPRSAFEEISTQAGDAERVYRL